MIYDDTTRSHEDEDNDSYELYDKWYDDTTINEEDTTMVRTMARLEIDDREPISYSDAHATPGRLARRNRGTRFMSSISASGIGTTGHRRAHNSPKTKPSPDKPCWPKRDYSPAEPLEKVFSFLYTYPRADAPANPNLGAE